MRLQRDRRRLLALVERDVEAAQLVPLPDDAARALEVHAPSVGVVEPDRLQRAALAHAPDARRRSRSMTVVKKPSAIAAEAAGFDRRERQRARVGEVGEHRVQARQPLARVHVVVEVERLEPSRRSPVFCTVFVRNEKPKKRSRHRSV